MPSLQRKENKDSEPWPGCGCLTHELTRPLIEWSRFRTITRAIQSGERDTELKGSQITGVDLPPLGPSSCRGTRGRSGFQNPFVGCHTVNEQLNTVYSVPRTIPFYFKRDTWKAKITIFAGPPCDRVRSTGNGQLNNVRTFAESFSLFGCSWAMKERLGYHMKALSQFPEE